VTYCFFVYDICVNETNVKDHVSFVVENLHFAYNTKECSEDNYRQWTRDINCRNNSLTDTSSWWEICQGLLSGIISIFPQTQCLPRPHHGSNDVCNESTLYLVLSLPCTICVIVTFVLAAPWPSQVWQEAHWDHISRLQLPSVLAMVRPLRVELECDQCPSSSPWDKFWMYVVARYPQLFISMYRKKNFLSQCIQRDSCSELN
jgi:hypothetical protein